MTPERHAKIQAIFEGAIDLSWSHRQRYMEENCLDDADLRARVERLLKAADGQESSTGDIHDQTTFVKECPACSHCFEGSTQTCTHDGVRLEPRFQGRLLIHGKYLIQRRLGHGGMGAVYLVKHLGLDKDFALKLILSDGVIPKHYRESFETEARALGRLKHPNIVDVTDYGVDPNSGGLPYLVMEYLEGRTLREVLKTRHTLPFPEALEVFRAVAAALDRAHQQNIVHGDLKPANLFLAKPANSIQVVKVVDFGLARLMPPAQEDKGTETSINASVDQRAGVRGSIRGTVPYMAPELFQGQEASAASDRYAFGAALYETLTGFFPYGESITEVLENFSSPPIAPSERNPLLPKELDEPVLALLNPRPSERPTTASGAVCSLEEAWLRAQQREWRLEESPRRFVLAIVATLLVLLLAGFAAKLRVSQVLEGRIWDARFATLPKHPPDPRLLVVTLDNATINADTRPLADIAWADEFGHNLERMFTSGAHGVAVDLLLPFSWSQSPEFARAVGRSADHLVLALFSTPSGNVIGDEGVSPLVARVLDPDRYRNLFGFVNLQEDEDRIIRRARSAYLDRSGQDRAAFAGRLAAVSLNRTRPIPMESPIWIDYSVPLDDIPKISWKDLPARLDTAPGLFRDKLIVVGADYEGTGDTTRVPPFVSANLVSGVFVQSLIVNTILEGPAVHAFGLAACMAVAGICCFLILALALRFPHRFGRLSVAAGIALCAYFLFAFVICRISHVMVTLVAPALAIAVSILVAWGLKSYLRPYPTPERMMTSRPSTMFLLRRKVLYAAALFVLLPIHAADCCKGSIAVIASLSGEASIHNPATQKRVTVASFDWLQPGATLEVTTGSSVTVILLNGRRYELGPGARATVTADGLTGSSGPVSELERLPPIPKATPIVDRTANTSGAVRLRGPAPIRNMYPREGMTALPNGLQFSFDSVPGASTYRIDLKDADGNILDNVQTAATHVVIPSGTVQAGATYSWHVRAIGSMGVVGEGEARFATISEQDGREREALARALSASKEDASAVALLADVDWRLGLLEEARQGLSAALRLRPGDAAIVHALEGVQAALTEEVKR
jgi:CHASE2 domain-containing sensor protein/predicted Ser/Thr protein kinase